MKSRTIIISALSILLIGFLIYNKMNSSEIESKKNAAPNPDIAKKIGAQVSAYVVSPGKLDNNVVSTGTVSANNEEQLFSEISGKITHIYFKEGGKVRKGELLVKINDADLQAQLAKAIAAKKIAGEIRDRDKKLLDKQGISQQEYDQSVSVLDQANADIALLNAQIAKTEIRSNYNGVIGLKSISEGSYITPAVKIASIQEIEPVKIDFSVPEKYTTQVRVGDLVTFTIPGSKDVFHAKIFAIEPKIDLATRSLLVRAICPNQDEKVLPGSFANVELILKQIDNAIMIPTQAVIPVLKGQQVYVSRNGKGQIVPVETGLRNDTTIEITNGLHAGDTVITTGIMMLKPGVNLKIKSVK